MHKIQVAWEGGIITDDELALFIALVCAASVAEKAKHV
jgi:hypothetical protein